MFENVVIRALGIDVQGLGCPRAGHVLPTAGIPRLLVRLHSTPLWLCHCLSHVSGVAFFTPPFWEHMPDHSSAWYKLGNVKGLGSFLSGHKIAHLISGAEKRYRRF